LHESPLFSHCLQLRSCTHHRYSWIDGLRELAETRVRSLSRTAAPTLACFSATELGLLLCISLKAFCAAPPPLFFTQVSAEQMAAAQHRFPTNTPATKEAYLFRHLFAQHFPSPAAAATVPGGPSIACR
jgi:hypothetical protein